MRLKRVCAARERKKKVSIGKNTIITTVKAQMQKYIKTLTKTCVIAENKRQKSSAA